MNPLRNTPSPESFHSLNPDQAAGASAPTADSFNSSIAAQHALNTYQQPQRTYAAPQPATLPYRTETFSSLNDNLGSLNLGGNDIHPGDSASNIGAPSTLGRTDYLAPQARKALEEANVKFALIKEYDDMPNALNNKDFTNVQFKSSGALSGLLSVSNDTPIMKQFLTTSLNSINDLMPSRKNKEIYNIANETLGFAIDFFKFAQQPDASTGKPVDIPNITFKDRAGSSNLSESLNNIAKDTNKKKFYVSKSKNAHDEGVSDLKDLNRIGAQLQSFLESPENIQNFRANNQAYATLETGRVMSSNHQKLIQNFTGDLNFFNRTIDRYNKIDSVSSDEFKANTSELKGIADKLVTASKDAPKMQKFATVLKNIATDLSPSSNILTAKKDDKENLSNLIKLFNHAIAFLPHALTVNGATKSYNDLPDIAVKSSNLNSKTLDDALQDIIADSRTTRSARKEAITDMKELLVLASQIAPPAPSVQS